MSTTDYFYVNDQVSHPYKTTGKIIVLYIVILKFLIATWKTNDDIYRDKFTLTFKLPHKIA